MAKANKLKVATGEGDPPMREWPLSRCVEASLGRYFEDLDGADAAGLYAMVMDEVERPLLEVVMRQAGHNQTRAARILGINRGTLRKKLALYGLE